MCVHCQVKCGMAQYWQKPIKMTWPRCPSCKTPVEKISHEAPPLEQEPCKQMKSLDLEISTAPPITGWGVRLPNLRALSLGQEASSSIGWGDCSPLQEANSAAVAAGFDKTCSRCKAPVRVIVSLRPYAWMHPFALFSCSLGCVVGLTD